MPAEKRPAMRRTDDAADHRRAAGDVWIQHYRFRHLPLPVKGCLYIKRLDDVDQEALRELIDRSVRVREGVDRASA
jgi:hypothetical protein